MWKDFESVKLLSFLIYLLKRERARYPIIDEATSKFSNRFEFIVATVSF